MSEGLIARCRLILEKMDIIKRPQMMHQSSLEVVWSTPTFNNVSLMCLMLHPFHWSARSLENGKYGRDLVDLFPVSIQLWQWIRRICGCLLFPVSGSDLISIDTLHRPYQITNLVETNQRNNSWKSDEMECLSFDCRASTRLKTTRV